MTCATKPADAEHDCGLRFKGDIKKIYPSLNLVDDDDWAGVAWQYFGSIAPHAIIGLDTETSGLNYCEDKLRLIQLASPLWGFAFAPDYWDLAFRILDEAPRVAVHHHLFDSRFLMDAGYLLSQGGRECTKTFAKIALPDLASHGLKSLCDAFHPELNLEQRNKELRTHMDERGYTWADCSVADRTYWAYGALDAVAVARLWNTFESLLWMGNAHAYLHQMNLQFDLENEHLLSADGDAICAAYEPAYKGLLSDPPETEPVSSVCNPNGMIVCDWDGDDVVS